MLDLTTLLPVASFGVAAYAALAGRLMSRATALREQEVTLANAQRDADVEVLKKQMELFWRMVEQHMTTVLHSPHTPGLDMLLEKYQGGIRLTPEEANDLSLQLLNIINNPDEIQGNRTGAVFLLAALDFRYQLNIAHSEGE